MVMKKLLLVLVCAVVAIASSAKPPVITDVSIVGEGVGNQGRPVIKATCSSKKAADVTDADLVRCAVRGVMFQGWVDGSNTSAFDASTNHPAVCGSPDVEVQHADYFADFFGGEDALKYAQILPDTRKVLKNGKVFNVSALVSVNVPALRAKLERDKVIKSLKSGW